jgi:hypothetical protein
MRKLNLSSDWKARKPRLASCVVVLMLGVSPLMSGCNSGKGPKTLEEFAPGIPAEMGKGPIDDQTSAFDHATLGPGGQLCSRQVGRDRMSNKEANWGDTHAAVEVVDATTGGALRLAGAAALTGITRPKVEVKHTGTQTKNVFVRKETVPKPEPVPDPR